MESCRALHESCSTDDGNVYFCFVDSTGHVNFSDFITKNIIMPDNGVDANALCIIEFIVINDGELEDIKVTSNCDFCNLAVEKAVEMSAPYWKLTHSARKKKIKVSFEYKYMIR